MQTVRGTALSRWFTHYGWGLLLGAIITFGSLRNLRRTPLRCSPRHHIGIDLLGVVVGTFISLLTAAAWAFGWK
jgi:F420-0:gamma-glutamyl ligase-like protein